MTGVRARVEERVGRLTLANARARNPLSVAVMEEITGHLRRWAEQGPTEVAVVVVDHEGPAFSAGHDLKEMRDRDLDFYRHAFDVCTEMMLTVRRVPQPVIAAVDGVATAAGCQLVASCDLALATERSTFATPGVRIGLFCSTPMVPISRAVGRKRAMQMLLTGNPIDAATAADWGLINAVVPDDGLDEAVAGLVADIVRWSPTTIAYGKGAFYEQLDRDEPGAYELTREVMSVNAADPVAREGIGAFVDKREPVWPDHPGAAS